MSVDGTTSRFFRPADVSGLRRNQRRIQVRRVLMVARNLLLLALVAGGGYWAWTRTQNDARFNVKTVDVSGVQHAPAAQIASITSQYSGANLFQLDIERMQNQLAAVGWVRHTEIEKALPDTLRIRVIERKPVALVRFGTQLRYVDVEGVAFAELSPKAGNDDLPLILDARGSELRRSVDFLESLHRTDPAVWSRISQIRPVPPHGFAAFDRQLGAIVYANAEDAAAKWRHLYAILEAESHPRIEYADLRFAGRVIVRNSEEMVPQVAAAAPVPQQQPPAGM